ncbi:MAG: hypothetical protein CM1200mP41_30140 [Gammaproteobacteria bacterium]|nr:MAG: hypothetical protein CM1200mP41_30140 [Gammaproteobacteria bacterium]
MLIEEINDPQKGDPRVKTINEVNEEIKTHPKTNPVMQIDRSPKTPDDKGQHGNRADPGEERPKRTGEADGNRADPTERNDQPNS